MKQNAIILAIATCTGITVWGGPNSDPAAGKRDAAWVGKRVEAWHPTKEERAFDQIGWARDLREAERLSKQHRRPVFLFTYDGASLSGYRC